MVDSSDLDSLELSLKKEVETFATYDDYERASKHHKENVGNYVSIPSRFFKILL